MKINNFYNVCNDSYPLYEYAVENGLFDGDYDDFCDQGEELTFFEGDPDMIKIDGQTGYFFQTGDSVYYYFDTYGSQDSQIEGILRDFFDQGYIGNFGYYKKFVTCKSVNEAYQNWGAWNDSKNCLAYRGGAGYTYTIIPLRQAAA